MPSKAKQTYAVIVVGGGVLGKTTALLAGSLGLDTVALTAGPPARSGESKVARIFTLNQKAKQLFARLGVWDQIESVTTVRAMQLYGPAGTHLPIKAHDVGVTQLAYTVDENELNAALAAKLAASQVKQIHDAPLDYLEQEADSATVRSARDSWRAKLVIGADGRHSPTALAAGITQETTYLEQNALVALATIKATPNTAWQWLRKDGLLALLPSVGGTYGIVWSLPAIQAGELLALGHDELAGELASACDQAGELIELGEVKSFELSSQMRQPVARRVALVGDSAHAFHPLAGQAISVSVGDLEALFGLIRDQSDPGAAALLARYRRLRYARIIATKRVTESIAKVLQPNSTLAPWLDLLMGIGGPFAPALVRLANAS